MVTATRTELQVSNPSDTSFEKLRRSKCSRCPTVDDDDDDDMDRREAVYAMLGSLLATFSAPAAASAARGQDAKIELPNPIESMSNRVTGQCLVETLGNRECLVYLDPANKLYQGADTSVLLLRIEKASEALASVPKLIESRKWSQITGILTGPMGTLVTTMNELVKLSENKSETAKLAKTTKEALIAIGQFADKKQGEKALEAHESATQNLVAFVKSL